MKGAIQMSNLENYMKQQAIFCEQNDSISKKLYSEYGVKRGLRDEKGQGVLTGLTNISDIKAFEYRDGVKSPCDGELSYRGYNIKDLVTGSKGKRFVFEEGAYLLLFGELPTDTQLMEFQGRLSDCMELPTNFTRDVIMKAPTSDIMGSMTRSILTLGSYDKEKESLEIPNVLRQSMQLIAAFPMLAVYAYHAYCHYEKNESMYIHRPEKDLSIAENFLRLLRPDTKFTELEARVLDIALLLHMEHGGGNNSTFTTRVVTSSGSDTYSVISAAMSSLKGKKHGGANLMVMNMMDDIKSHVKDYEDEEEIASYLSKILKKEAFDQKGLIYGMGHAVYSISDPRERVFKGFVEQLARDKGREKDMTLYNNIEKIAPKLIAKQRQIFKGVSPNIDFYSGFVYDMLNIPRELYTPLFAIARMEHQVYRDQAQGVILDAYGKMVVEECKKFDEKTKQKIHDYIQQQVPLNPVEQLKQDGKIRLEHYQKFYQNGTYERSRESGTEANYDMVDGLVNNQKKNPEKISDAHSNKQTSRNQQDNKPKKRRSVIKRLHQKQIAIARRSGKPIPKYLDQEMERKRG
ncbi:citrate synthase [Coprococcus sp. LG100-32]|jgi:citrate synthase|uniref:citrate synthase n=1 Tax=Coprococcus sp. LG100-32 TaxID=2997994 RepID=UPI0022E21ABE|nr:citrate synthase [Coprococcus sp. LG100-32]